jgi:hypothetical protein
MNCPVDCSNVRHNDDGSVTREWTIDVEGRVWPCCLYANIWGDTRTDPIDQLRKVQDTTFVNLFKLDPNWNNLKHYTLEEITANEVFWTKTWFPGWESGDMTNICRMCMRPDTKLFKKRD